MHEEIGQIQYMFCDKTGTLTKNELLFRKMAIRDEGIKQRATAGQTSSHVLQPSECLDNMLRCILICHDVLRVKGNLSGSSQDELVMMEMIEKDYQAKFLMRDTSSIKISLRGVEEIYDIIQIHEFTSDRKMMSITVQKQGDAQLINFAKGADMMIKNKLNETGDTERALINDLDEYAK